MDVEVPVAPTDEVMLPECVEDIESDLVKDSDKIDKPPKFDEQDQSWFAVYALIMRTIGWRISMPGPGGSEKERH